MGYTARQTPRSVHKKKEKLKSSYSKWYILEKYPSCIRSPRIGLGWLPVRCQAVRMMDVGWSGTQVPGGLVSPRLAWVMGV